MSCYQESEVVQRHFYQSRYQQFKNGDSIKLRVAYRNKWNGLYVYGDDPQNIIFHDFETSAKTIQTFLKELDKFFDLVENHTDEYQNTWGQSHWEYRHHNHPEKARYIKRTHHNKKRMPTRSELVAKLSGEKLQEAFYGRPAQHGYSNQTKRNVGVSYRVTETADLVKKWERFRAVTENR